MSPLITEKELLKEKLKEIEKIPPEKRKRAFKRYRKMSEKERERSIEASPFWKGLNENEREAIKRLYFPDKK